MNKLLDYISKKAIELSKIKIPDKKEAEFFSKFLSIYNANIFDTYKSISNVGYVAAVLRINDIPLEFEEFWELIKNVANVFDNPQLDVSVLELYFKTLKKLNDDGVLKDCSPNTIDLDSETLQQYKNNDLRKLDHFICSCDKNGHYDIIASESLIRLFKLLPNPDLFMSFNELLIIGNFDSNMCDNIINEFKDECANSSVSKFIDAQHDRIINEAIRDFVKIKKFKIYDYYHAMIERYEKLYKKAEMLIKETNRKISFLEQMDHKFSDWPSNLLFSLEKDFSKVCFDLEIDSKLLLHAIKHNFNVQKQAEQKNKEYNDNSITKLDILFSKYGFNFNGVREKERQEIILLETGHIEEILKQIRYSDLIFLSEYIDLFGKIIKYSNSRNLKILDICLKNKIITREFLLENSELLYSAELFNNFFNNLNNLANLGVSLNGKAMSGILLLDNEYLNRQTDMLYEYKVNFCDESFTNYELLKNGELLDCLDQFIELGYKDCVLKNLKYLNIDSLNTIKRIMIAQLIGLSPLNNFEKFIGPITTGNDFYVGTEECDKFIIDYKQAYQNPTCCKILNENSRNLISVSIKNYPIIKAMDDNFMSDSLYYIIDGVIISRKRVMRNFEALIKNIDVLDISMYDLLYQAILYNMIDNVEHEKLEQIYDSICSMKINNNNKTYTLN